MPSRVRRGFTLIELLVVIAILATLAAVLLPVLEIVNKRAEAASCLMNIRSLALANSLYAEDNDGFIVPARVSVPTPGLLGATWDVCLYPYHRNELLYLCPADQMATYATGNVCYNHSYGINFDLTMLNGYNGAALQVGQVDSPTEVILFFEIKGSLRQFGTRYSTDGLSRVDVRHNTGSNYSYLDGHARWRRPENTTFPVNEWTVH